MSPAARWRRRPVVVLAGLAAGGLLLALTTQPWVMASLPVGPGGSAPDLPVTGSSAAAAVPALGLVAVAGAVALSLVRGPGRVVVSVLLLAAGLGGGAAVVALVLDPVPAAEAAARAATGVADVEGARVTGWPVLAVLPCVVAAAAGAVALGAGRAWGASGRFESPRSAAARAGAQVRVAAPPTRAGLWDDLSQGTDPTDGPTDDPTDEPPRDATTAPSPVRPPGAAE